MPGDGQVDVSQVNRLYQQVFDKPSSQIGTEIRSFVPPLEKQKFSPDLQALFQDAINNRTLGARMRERFQIVTHQAAEIVRTLAPQPAERLTSYANESVDKYTREARRRGLQIKAGFYDALSKGESVLANLHVNQDVLWGQANSHRSAANLCRGVANTLRRPPLPQAR